MICTLGGVLFQSKPQEGGVYLLYLGDIDKTIFMSITTDLLTTEVILSDTQIKHIQSHHPNIFERYCTYLTQMIEFPDYVIEANLPNTALILKSFYEYGEQFKLVLRLQTSNDPNHYKNSVITFMKIDEKEWNSLLRNKKVLYKSKNIG